MKSKTFIALIFLGGKLLEILPLFLEDIFYFVLNSIVKFLELLKIFPYYLKTHLYYRLTFFSGLPIYGLLISLLIVLVIPILIGVITKSKKLTKLYWKLSTLADFILLLYVSFSPCDSGFFIGLCGLAIFFAFGLFISALVSRSIGLLLAYQVIREAN